MDKGSFGYQQPGDANTEFNATAFVVTAILRRMSTATVVKVVGVTNAGGVSPVGFVNIVPQVNQVDGAGNSVPHATIYECPYLRIQGGANAVILDPQIGDLGIAVFADRDISSVIANLGQANPGSARRFDMADALYIGGILNGVPSQYVQFSSSGIALVSPTAINLAAPSITLAAPTIALNATTGVAITSPSLTHNGVNVGSTHEHGGVQSGGSNTAVPH